jgi:hypothetical protein
MKTNTLAKIVLGGTLIAGTLVSCDGGDTPIKEKPDHKKANPKIFNKSQSLNATLNGKVFSIPSPIETALLLKSKGGDFDGSILNNPENVDNYTTASKKALAMGVYGTDLGYSTIYDQNQQSVGYIKSIKKLSSDLGISGAFDAKLIERFMENGNNQDSLLSLVSEAYSNGDKFLKDNKRDDVAIKILTGGWIESIYFASEVCLKSKNQEIMQRIGEQKPTLNNLLSIYRSSEPTSDLTMQLTSLNELFAEVKMESTDIQVIDDEGKKSSVIQSNSSINMDELIEALEGRGVLYKRVSNFEKQKN